jgi:hypothetical protein
MCSVSMGKATILWLLAVMEEVTVQRSANRSGCFLVISEYGRGGRCSSIVIPEGRERKGWYGWVIEL